MFSPLTQQLIDALRMLPGVGPKTAQRLAFQLLAEGGRVDGLALADALQAALSAVKNCERCFLYTEQSLCTLCQQPRRNQQLLCVVENPADLVAIEQTGSYQGLYHVLQGHLSPLDGQGPSEIGIPALLARLAQEPIEELIIATNATMEGKATAQYIVQHTDTSRIRCTRIAHGVPLGGELEYLDSGTVTHAFESRLVLKNNEKDYV